jgi:predicted nuclease of predicted toxin-antitoxin system
LLSNQDQRPRNILRLFLDECVPDSVGRVFWAAGHHVIYLRQAGATGSPDQLVCTLAEENDAILVSLDGDMKQLAKDNGVGKKRFTRLSLIKFSCDTVNAASRAKDAMSLFEHEWERCEGKSDRRLFVEVFTNSISIKR